MRQMRRTAAAIFLLLAGTAAFGSPPDPCSLTSTVPDAKVTVAISNGQTSFREGEIIPLVFSFTSTAAKRYWADNRNYDRSGRLNIETYCVEPPARDALADYFKTGMFMGGGLGSTQQLSEKPFTATAELNEWRQPGPGHYRLYVVSYRVWRPPDPNESTPYGRVAVTLRSAPIEFDVIKADPDWQAEQLREDTTAFHNASTVEVKKAAGRRLRFLNTRESTEMLARLFWSLNDQPGGWDLMFGLFGSPYRAEAIAAMQRQIKDPGRAITQDFLRSLTKLQIESDAAWNPPEYDPAHPNISQEYWQKRQAHERELMRAAAAEMMAALPQKARGPRALTAQTLAEASDLLNEGSAAQIRKQLIAGWGDLPMQAKLELIQYRWPVIAGPEMLPVLKEFVSGPAPPFRTEPATARDAALKHILELDPDEGRALILRDLSDSKAQPSISLAKLLSADELRPIMKEAVTRIQKNDARELDFTCLSFTAINPPSRKWSTCSLTISVNGHATRKMRC